MPWLSAYIRVIRGFNCGYLDQLAAGGFAASLAQRLGEGVRMNAFCRRIFALATSGEFSLLKPLTSRSTEK
jgi:hypothetical protein